MYKTSDFDYFLPQELIAQKPLKNREMCKMMYINKEKETIENKQFFDILDYLNKDDILVLNDTKVYPARLLAKRTTGANVEIFLLNPIDNSNHWEALAKNTRRVKNNEILSKEFSDIDFTRGWNGQVVKGIYYDLKEIIPNFDIK